MTGKDLTALTALSGATIVPPAQPSPTLPKARRLTRRRDIVRLLHKGIFLKGRGMSMRVLPCVVNNDTMPAGRLLVAVSKRYGHAPRRNRLKRWIRESLRNHPLWPDLPWDVGFFVSTSTPHMAHFKCVCQEVNGLLLAANKRCATPLAQRER